MVGFQYSSSYFQGNMSFGWKGDIRLSSRQRWQQHTIVIVQKLIELKRSGITLNIDDTGSILLVIPRVYQKN